MASENAYHPKKRFHSVPFLPWGLRLTCLTYPVDDGTREIVTFSPEILWELCLHSYTSRNFGSEPVGSFSFLVLVGDIISTWDYSYPFSNCPLFQFAVGGPAQYDHYDKKIAQNNLEDWWDSIKNNNTVIEYISRLSQKGGKSEEERLIIEQGFQEDPSEQREVLYSQEELNRPLSEKEAAEIIGSKWSGL